MHPVMRTTLAIDDDVLLAARGLAEAQRKSMGEVVSELARQGLAASAKARKRRGQATVRNGIPLLRAVQGGAVPVTLELVNRLRHLPNH
jgi:hypothetical protein